MSRKLGLGKGLDALITSSSVQPESTASPGGVIQIPVDRIASNPHQPRAKFDPQELEELALSIKEHGVIQPLLVTQDDSPGRYTLIAGERRLLASRQAGLTKVPAIIREANEQERVELALIENLQRADLSPIETAEAYRHLVEEYKLPHEQIAARVGKSRTTVTNTLRLLNLPKAVLEALAEAQISEGHARALLSLTSQQAQLAALQTVLQQRFNVRQTEELVRKLSGQKPPQKPKPAATAEVSALEERLRECLGTKVTINNRRKGGSLVIHYYSEEELDTLIARILQDENEN